MSLTALALSAALLVPQTPASHETAVACTGLFVNVYARLAALAEENPTGENKDLAATAQEGLRNADNDRLAAARREGISIEASGAALNAWLDANADDFEGMIERELEPCLALYVDMF